MITSGVNPVSFTPVHCALWVSCAESHGSVCQPRALIVNPGLAAWFVIYATPAQISLRRVPTNPYRNSANRIGGNRLQSPPGYPAIENFASVSDDRVRRRTRSEEITPVGG
jgi:hypothetical protein